MNIVQLLSLVTLHLFLCHFVTGNEIIAKTSPGNHILYDKLYRGKHRDAWKLTVSSDNPVSIHRQSNKPGWTDQPVRDNEIRVIISSNCSTDNTSITPNVTVTHRGYSSESSESIDIKTDGGQSPTEFLLSNFYHAVWHVSDECYYDIYSQELHEDFPFDGHWEPDITFNTPPGEHQIIDGGSAPSKLSHEHLELANPGSCAHPSRRSLLFSFIALLQSAESAKRTVRRVQEYDTCVTNTEVLLDSSWEVNVTGPMIRVINSTIENLARENVHHGWNYEADLRFESEPTLEKSISLSIPKGSEVVSWDCGVAPYEWQHNPTDCRVLIHGDKHTNSYWHNEHFLCRTNVRPCEATSSDDIEMSLPNGMVLKLGLGEQEPSGNNPERFVGGPAEVWQLWVDRQGNYKNSPWHTLYRYCSEGHWYDESYEGCYDVNDFKFGSLECGPQDDQKDDYLLILIDGVLVDSCPKMVAEECRACTIAK